MTRNPEVLTIRATVRDAAVRMRDSRIGFFPVLDDSGQLVGVVTDRDLAVRVVADGRPLDTPVEVVMTGEIITCSPQESLQRVEELMRVNHKVRLPVMDEGGRLAGVISLADLDEYKESVAAGEVVSITSPEANP